MRKMSVQLVCNYDIPVKMGYQSFSDICIPQEVLTELQQKDLEGAYQTTLNYLNNGEIDPATYVNCAIVINTVAQDDGSSFRVSYNPPTTTSSSQASSSPTSSASSSPPSQASSSPTTSSSSNTPTTSASPSSATQSSSSSTNTISSSAQQQSNNESSSSSLPTVSLSNPATQASSSSTSIASSSSASNSNNSSSQSSSSASSSSSSQTVQQYIEQGNTSMAQAYLTNQYNQGNISQTQYNDYSNIINMINTLNMQGQSLSDIVPNALVQLKKLYYSVKSAKAQPSQLIAIAKGLKAVQNEFPTYYNQIQTEEGLINNILSTLATQNIGGLPSVLGLSTVGLRPSSNIQING